MTDGARPVFTHAPPSDDYFRRAGETKQPGKGSGNVMTGT